MIIDIIDSIENGIQIRLEEKERIKEQLTRSRLSESKIKELQYSYAYICGEIVGLKIAQEIHKKALE